MAKRIGNEGHVKIQVVIITIFFIIILVIIISGMDFQNITNKIGKIINPAISGLAVSSGSTEIVGCYDSDGGIKPYVLGNTTLNNISYTDRCLAGNKLIEYYCSNSVIGGSGNGAYGSSSSGTVTSVSTSCPDGCTIGDGKCLLNAPTGLRATLISTSEIDLSWKDNSNAESGFDIFRSKDGKTWTLIGSTPLNTNYYQDLNINGILNYQYRVRAKNNQVVTDFTSSSTSKLAGNITCYSDDDCSANSLVPNGPICVDEISSSCLIYPSGKCVSPGTSDSYCLPYDRYVCTQCQTSCNPADGNCLSEIQTLNQSNENLSLETNTETTPETTQTTGSEGTNTNTNINSQNNIAPSILSQCQNNKQQKILLGSPSIIPINNKNYDTSIDFMTSDSVKLKINGVTTNYLGIGDSYQIDNGAYVKVYSVLSQNYQGGSQEADIIIYYNCAQATQNPSNGQPTTTGQTETTTSTNPLTIVSVSILCKLAHPFNSDNYQICVNQRTG